MKKESTKQIEEIKLTLRNAEAKNEEMARTYKSQDE